MNRFADKVFIETPAEISPLPVATSMPKRIAESAAILAKNATQGLAQDSFETAVRGSFFLSDAYDVATGILWVVPAHTVSAVESAYEWTFGD